MKTRKSLLVLLSFIVFAFLSGGCISKSNPSNSNINDNSQEQIREDSKNNTEIKPESEYSTRDISLNSTGRGSITVYSTQKLNSEKSSDIKNELLKEKVRQMTNSFVKSKNFSGCILVGYKGEVLLKEAFGKANIKESINNSIDTRFMIASMTKQFTAMSILILQEKGALSTDDTLNKYIPDLPMSDKITIHQLLTHTSGLPIFLPNSRGDNYLKNYPGATNEEKIMNGIKKGDIKVSFPPPGSSFNYSDINYMLLGHIVEKVSGIPFEDFLKQNIFVPLEMDCSGVGYNPDRDTKLAIGYGPRGNTLSAGLTCSDMGYGAGSMYSTVEDLYKWDRALYTEKIVHKKSLETMFTRYNNTYGYGWWFSETKKGFIPVHGGRLLNGSFSGFYVRNPIEDICVIILGNDGNHDDKRAFAEEVNLALMN